jgi:hypothetical protein
VIEVKVPHPHFKVASFDAAEDKWVDAKADVICHVQQQELNPDQTIDDCIMNIEQTIGGGEIGFTRVQFDSEHSLTENCHEETAAKQIKSDSLTLTYKGVEDDIIWFEQATGGASHEVGLSLRYWAAYNKYVPTQVNNQMDGAYIFRPVLDQYDSDIYSQPTNVVVHQCEVSQQFIIDFVGEKTEKKKDQIQGDATVRVSVQKGMPGFRVDVELFGLPQNKQVGQEVTVNFHSKIQNNGVFFTDSNGLEMQRRELNYRPTFEIETKNSVNITANYYPIGSAISIRDEHTQMIVMNDRAQGGSVIQDGRIELMQNRRSNADDSRGVDENIDETDVNGNGVSVPASYRVHIGLLPEFVYGGVQRFLQQGIDSPLQQFYGFDGTDLKQSRNFKPVQQGFQRLLENTGFTQEMKLEMFTQGPNQIVVRIEHLSDPTDGATNIAQIKHIDLFNGIFELAQGNDSAKAHMSFEEQSLTANQPIDLLRETKIHWRTADNRAAPRLPEDGEDFISLQPQRIRVFRVKYKPVSDVEFLLQNIQ